MYSCLNELFVKQKTFHTFTVVVVVVVNIHWAKFTFSLCVQGNKSSFYI